MRARPADPTLDRADLAFANHRGLRKSQSVGADQKDRLALMNRKLRQGIPKVRRDRPSVLVWHGCGPFDVAGAHDLAPQTLFAADIHELIPQDRGQPGAQIGALLESVEVRPRAEQRILDEVIGLVCAAAQ
jgi:hypothetical protein